VTSCLVTGGAGFIGSAVSAELLRLFDPVVVVDSLHRQIHPRQVRPDSLAAGAELVVADVCEPATWESVLDRVRPDVVLHLAAETGTGQSLTESTRHAWVNVVGLTRLLDALSRRKAFPSHLLLTSSRAVYGEGAWRRANGEVFHPLPRSLPQLERGEWGFGEAEALASVAGRTEPRPTSVYGATKLAQEHVLSAWAQGFGVPITTLRLQNVYGPGQSLTNSYTGIVTLFARLAREGKSIPLYEDGTMLRDFVFIDDVSQGIVAALRRPPASDRTLDIGSGRSDSIATMASLIAQRYRAPEPRVTGAFRPGDVRHALTDISAARTVLDYSPRVSLAEGLRRLCEWVDGEAVKES
jgi:dTDP-L-rhamnose 4-epimerase